MRQLRKGPLFAAVAIPVLFAPSVAPSLTGTASAGSPGWTSRGSSYRCGRST